MAVRLIEQLLKSRWSDLPEVREAGETLRDFFREDLDLESFDALDDLWEASDDLISSDLRADLADEFDYFVQHRLRASDLDSDELRRIEDLADSYGVYLDDLQVEDAHRRLAEPDDDEIDPSSAAHGETSPVGDSDEDLVALFDALRGPEH